MNKVAIVNSRLPMPDTLTDIDAGKWRVLCEAIFPNAKTAEAIVMALDYCRARKLDPFKRPVNIVPMYNKTLKKEVETVWPSINEVQVTASRTGQFAGMDEPKWGRDITKIFEGEFKGYGDEGKWEEKKIKIELTFPESCSVTVYRMISGIRCPFTEPVFWLETYARKGRTELPNPMWEKRPRGQFLKVAKAFSIRVAFPEEGSYTAEEMEGKIIEETDFYVDSVAIDKRPTSKDVFGSNKAMKKVFDDIVEQINNAGNEEELDAIFTQHNVNLAQFHKVDPTFYENIMAMESKRRDTISMLTNQRSEFEDSNSVVDGEIQDELSEIAGRFEPSKPLTNSKLDIPTPKVPNDEKMPKFIGKKQ